MRILQIAPYYPPYLGGQERYVQCLSKQLVKMGHEVTVRTSNYPKGDKKETMDGVKIERYPCLARPLRNPITPSLIGDTARLDSFDVVQVHNEHSFAAIASLISKIRTNKPMILNCHGQLRFGNAVLDSFEKAYSKLFGRIILSAMDTVIVQSNADMSYISKFTRGTNVEIVPNAVDEDELKKMSSLTEEVDKEGSGFGDKTIALFVGQVIRRKGIESILRSVPLILEQVGKNNFAYMIVGSGDFLEEARRLSRELKIEENVIFKGRVSDEDLVRHYKTSDLLVLPSISEGMPTTILEAMYFGLPVITSDIPGVRDNFKESALLVPPQDPSVLASSVVELINDSRTAQHYSRAGMDEVREKYTWEKVARKYETIYGEISS